MAAILEGDTDASRLSASGSVWVTGKSITSQSGLAAEGSLLLQDSSDMIGFVFIQAMATSVAHFVFHGGVQQVGHSHMPTGYEFTRSRRHLGQQSFFDESRSRFQAGKRGAIGIEPQRSGLRLPILRAHQHPGPFAEGVGWILCYYGLQRGDLLAAGIQYIAGVAKEMLCCQAIISGAGACNSGRRDGNQQNWSRYRSDASLEFHTAPPVAPRNSAIYRSTAMQGNADASQI